MNGIIITAIICGSLVIFAVLRFIERQIKRKRGSAAGEVLGNALSNDD